MIDKELSELKNDIPDIDIKDFKSGIYQKYSNKETTRKIYFPKVAFVLIVVLLAICFPIGIKLAQLGGGKDGPLPEKTTILIDSYSGQKIMPSTIFNIKLNEKYSIEEEYKIVVKYGTLKYFEQDIYIDANAALLQIHSSDSLDKGDLPNGTILYRVDNFLTLQNRIDYDLVNGKYKNITFNQEIEVSIPKDYIKGDTGVFCLSFVCFCLNESGEIVFDDNYDGSNIYIKYEIIGDEIIFSKSK